MQRIGILGGTFDPPHIGHLILAEYTVEALELERVLFVPAADPPHKRDQTRTPIQHRLAMLECAIVGNDRFSISMVDIERPGPHYSVDTVRIIQAQYPNAELFFVMGGDSLRDLPRWHNPDELIQLCKLAVMRRSDEDVHPQMHQDVLPELAERVIMVDAPLLGIWISSTHVVQRLQKGKSARYVVPQLVLRYIEKHHIYRNSLSGVE
jgi:nicotinate-nucleotide adenylyltransferase